MDKTFPNPFAIEAPEGAEGWEALYPYYYTFSEARRDFEEGKFWFFDGMHNPEPVYPFDAIMTENWAVAVNQLTTRVWQIPPALGIDHRVVNGYLYISPNAVTDPDLIAARAEVFSSARATTSRTGTRSTPPGSTRRRLHRAAEGDRVRAAARARGRARRHRAPRRLRDLPPAAPYAACSRTCSRWARTTSRCSTSATARTSRSASSASARSPASPTRRSPGWSPASTSCSSGPTTRCGSSRARDRARPRRCRAGERRARRALAAIGRAATARSGCARSRRQGAVVLVLDRRRLHAHRPGLDRRPAPPAQRAARLRAALQAGEDSSTPARAGPRGARPHHRRVPRAARRRRGPRGVRRARQPRAHRLSVRREPQLLRRALAPLDLLVEGARARRTCSSRTGSSPTREDIFFLRRDGDPRRAVRPLHRLGDGDGRSRAHLLAGDRGAAPRDLRGAAGVDAAARARPAARPRSPSRSRSCSGASPRTTSTSGSAARVTDTATLRRRRGLAAASCAGGPAWSTTRRRPARRRDGRDPRLPHHRPVLGARVLEDRRRGLRHRRDHGAHRDRLARVRAAGRRRHRLCDAADPDRPAASRSTATTASSRSCDEEGT